MSEPTSGEVERFKRIEEVFVQVCDLEINQRAELLDRLCAGDNALRTSVLDMLRADQTSNPILEQAIITESIVDDQEIPAMIGSFEILGVLGEGGMGVVYEAIQQSPKRHVALKVIRQRSAHEQIRRRFESEADILAKLNHPGIATIYESGVAQDESGATPYVAMELVHGESINLYAKNHDLDISERITLVRDVCRAVAHAHSLGIVHRDIKPSNLLVDGEGQIKVLDFGIALDMEIEHRTQMTLAGQLLGTLQYMAPEQVDSSVRGTQTQTDVYALGIVCYELLAGENPVAKHDSSMYELVRAIRDEDFDPLSTHSRAFRGDLETIVRKALSKSADRRYKNAGALADDLDRYLEHQPIKARKPSTWYQFSMFSRRNPVLVGSFGIVLLVLVAAVALIGNALRVANHQRELAEHDKRIKLLVNGFMSDGLFATADPSAGGDPSISLLDAMREASAGLSERFAEAPEVEAEIRFTIGDQFGVMNRYREAREHLERSAALSEQLGLDVDVLVERRNALCQVYSDINELDLALVYITRTNAILDEHPEASAESRIDTLMEHASLLFHMEQPEQAAEVFKQAIDFGTDKAPRYEGTINAAADLAVVYTQLGQYDEALVFHQQTIEHSVRMFGPEHPDTLVSRDNLGLLYIEMGRYEDAFRALTDVLEARNRVFGPHHVKTYITRAMLARALSHLGKHEDAGGHIIAAHDGLSEILGSNHRYPKITRGFAAQIFTRAGRDDLVERYTSTE